MRDVFLRIVGFVIVIDLFYMGIGRLYLTQSEEHPPEELQITVETDIDTLVGMGELLLKNKGGCLLCHKITEVGNTRGPDLRGVGGRAGTRKPGQSAETYLTESLVDPGAYVVAEFATPGGESIMPAADKPPADMSPTEIKALVAYLQSLSGEITVVVTAEDVAAAELRKQKPPAPTSSHPGFALLNSKGCVACHDVIENNRRVGPPLTHVGERLTAADIRQSILDPDAVIAEGFMKGLMLKDFGTTLQPEELDQLVSYLSGEVSLSERLAHPGVHLLILILLFNGGVAWASRAVASLPDASDEGEVSASKPPWIWFGAIGAAVLIGGIYLALGTGEEALDAEPPAGEPAVVQKFELAPGASPEAPVAVAAPDGAALYKVTCPACHGQEAQGVQGLGKDMTTSEFVAGLSDEELVAFIIEGRAADDPMNTTGVAMPPRGMNVALSDDDVMAIVKFIRSLSQ
jgi:disulfide bond formation protein DsbB